MAKQRKRSVHGSGSVYQRKSDGRWVAKLKVEETGKYRELYAATEKEAYKKLEEAQFEQKQGAFVAGSQQTVKQYLEYWLEDVHKDTVRLGTYTNNRITVNKHIIPSIGHFKLQKLTAQQVQMFYAKKLREGMTASRVRRIHAVLHKALNYAKRNRLVSNNVCDNLELPRERKPEMGALTIEQAKRLLQVVQGHHLEMLITLAITTGMRRGELLSLRWQDIDIEKGVLRVRRTVNFISGHGFIEGEPKTAKSTRDILLPSFVLTMLKQYRVEQAKMRVQADSTYIDRDLVFANEDGGFIRFTTLRYHFNRLLDEAGLPHIRFHDLRHSAASLLLSMGVPIKVVQELLGHNTVDMTLNTYSHVYPAMRREAMEKMENLFGQQP